MSTVGQGAGAVIGAVIGFVATGGNPIGAIQGASIGASIGGYLDPPKGPTVSGPRLGDKSVQTSTYGTMLPRFYGTIGVSGNITWLENNQLKETVRKKKQGGKGGGSKTTVKTYSYSATFFLSLGEGPIAGVRRIWCSDKLIYNAGSDDLETIIASNQAATGFKVYLGTDDQLPDPRYEADVGVGNASAYRGEAYIAFYDFQLADYSNTLQGAQFKVEVVKSAAFVGLRQVLDAQSGLTYGAAPYIYKAESSVFATASGTQANIHSPAGQLSGILTPSDNEVLPGDGGTLHYAGRLGGKFLFGTVTDVEYVDNVDIGFRDPGGLSVPMPASVGIDLTGKKLVSMTVNSSGTLAVLFFRDLAGSITATHAGFWYVVDTDLGLVSSGVYSSGSITALGYGVSARYHFGALCLSEDGSTIYRAYGAGSREFEKVELATWSKTTLNFALLSGGSFTRPAIYEKDAIIYVIAGTGIYHFVDSPEVNSQLVPLADLIQAEVALSSLLTVADLDTSLLAAQVRGYRVSGGSIRSALEPLQGAFPFDIIQSGYQLKCVPRGQASVMTIPWEVLGAADGDTPGDLLKESREMDTQLPALVSVKYLDALREYAVAEQSKPRINTQAINRVDRELALVLTADEAAAVAEVLCELPWLERTPSSFSLPPPYLALEPADVVTIVAPWATYEVRLTEGNYTPSGRGEWEAKPNRAALYTSNAKGSEGVPPVGTIPLAGESLFLPLDIPVVDETLQDAPGFVGVMTGYTEGWPGGVAFRSADGGQTYNDLQAYAGKATLGNASGALPASDGTQIDQRSMVVYLVSGELESITRDQMLVGQNYAAYGADGRWEIVRFQNAVLQADGSYLVSSFVRGDRGTEWATGLHVAGDYFILLDDPDNAFIGMAVGSLGVAATYRGVTSGASIDSASDVPFTYQGVNLECLSPVSARGVRDGSGNFTGNFVRRSRLSSSWWTTGVPAPVGESTEAYDIDVMSDDTPSATVKRTIAATTPAFNYSAANQATDFGSAQAAITFRIYQRSEVVGRGYPLEVTL